MSKSAYPFAVPTALPQPLDYLRGYWEGLRRAENEMPFWDDVNLSALPDLASCLMLVDVFEQPERFRVNTLGTEIENRYGRNIKGKFIDEIEPTAPFEYFMGQGSITLEARRPTFLQLGSTEADSYQRLLLPMWGNGRIETLLGAVA